MRLKNYKFQETPILHKIILTFFFVSSHLTSLRTFAQGTSAGHQIGRYSGLPHPGLLRPVEYFSISGINALSCACKLNRNQSP